MNIPRSEVDYRIHTRLDSQDKSLGIIVKTVKSMEAQMAHIRNHPFLQPLSKPLQSKYGRRPNVAKMFRAEIEKANALKAPGEERYLTFPRDRTDDQLNRDMKRTIYGIMALFLAPISKWQKLTWSEIQERDGLLAERVIVAAAAKEEFRVVAQGAGNFGIHQIADQRQQQRSVGDKAEIRDEDGEKKSKRRRNNKESRFPLMIEGNDEPVITARAIQENQRDLHISDKIPYNISPEIVPSFSSDAEVNATTKNKDSQKLQKVPLKIPQTNQDTDDPLIPELNDTDAARLQTNALTIMLRETEEGQEANQSPIESSLAGNNGLQSSLKFKAKSPTASKFSIQQVQALLEMDPATRKMFLDGM